MKEKPTSKNWCIKLLTREINDAVNSISLWKHGMLYWENAPNYINYYIGYDGKYSRNLLKEGYSEITFEQFKKYVLKEEETKTNKTMKKPFAITGSTILKEAFVKEAGLKPCAPGSIPDYKYLTPYSKNVVVGHSVLVVESIEFSLPKDYDEALEYVKTYWKEEFNVGDWIWNSEKGEVFQIEEIHEDKDACSGNGRSNFYYTLHTDSSKEYWSRKATLEEIKNATELKVGDWLYIMDSKLNRDTNPNSIGELIELEEVHKDNYSVDSLWLNFTPKKFGGGGYRVGGNGLTLNVDIRKATPEEIEKAKKLKELKEPQFPKISGYKGVIEGNLFAYGCKKFNKEELDTIIEASNLLKRLDGYSASITDNSVIVKSTAISIDDLRRASKLLPKKKLEYGGDIKDFPEEVVEMMLDRQVEQGNPRNPSVFERDKNADKSSGGFDWYNSTEGYNFWSRVIGDQKFDKFFERYPKEITNKIGE